MNDKDKKSPRPPRGENRSHRADRPGGGNSGKNAGGLKKSAREAAYLSLLRCLRESSFSNLEADSAIRKYSLAGVEKGFYTTLVYGVIERRLTLDYIISLLSSKPVGSLDDEIMTILRLGLYQLIYLDRVPESAAVNESVKLAKAVKPGAASFVNAVLRGFLRKYSKDNLPYPGKSDFIKYLSVRYSCGEEVVRILERAGEVESLLAAFESDSRVTLRVNTLKTSRDEVMARLAEEGIDARETAVSPDGILISGLSDAARRMISDGLVFVQDEASQLVSHVLMPKAGERVLDICACPGGKSFSMAMKMGNEGEILAFDLHKNKLSLIDSGAERLGISVIKTAEKNGAVYDKSLDSTADAILCDVPCSGLGVISKKPEIRYKSPADIERLPEIQYSILENSSRYLKKGGRLCYSTCTLNPDENSGVVERFLAAHDDFEPVPFYVGNLASEGGKLTLRPDRNGTDGFFISLLRRKI